ncbi:MAG: PAS domain S-box protein, partial [Kiritimatiellae bacterium]|nr:PAS domain S-box protein [Kiritimatiellia bacterium]
PLESRAKPLLERFRVLAKHFGYTDMLLVDVAGKIRLSLSGATDLEADCKESLSLAAREGCPMLTDLHLNLQKTDPHISVVAPILSGGGDARADLLGKVVLVSGANRFLYPLLQSWPTASGTAETTLARRDGDDALFLNPARHQPDTALRLRVPLSRKDVVAVKAVSGIEGVCNGVDYRNKPVLAFTRAVPGTNWFIAAKQDIDEIIGDWRFIYRLTFAVMLSLSLGLFAAVQMVWLRSQAQHYQALYEAEAALRASTDRQSITLRAINDAVLVTDDRGLVEFINPVAARLTGWDESKARGRPLEDVLHIVHEGTRERLPSPPEWGLRGYAASGPDNQMLLIGRDGAECPISVSASPILGGNGSPCGVVLVCRDQTDAENYRTLFRRMLDGFAVHEMIFDEAGKPVDYRFLAVNPAFESMTGLRGTEVVGKTMREVFPGIEQHWFDAYGKVVQTGEPSHFESFAGQLNKFFDVAAFRPAPNQFAVIIQDITPRKKIEIELTESEKKYRSLTDDVLDTTEVGIFILDSAFNVVWVNRTMGRFFGVERDAVVGRPKRTLIKSRLARIFEDPAGFAAKVLATYDDNTYTEKFECHVLAGEGREERWLQHWSQPVRTGLYAGGRIEHYYDITEIKQTEARQRRLVAAIEQSGEIVMVTDPAGVILYVNEAFERVTGYTRPEAIGKTPSILKSGKHGVEFYQQMWQTLLRQEIYRGRLINKRKDGSFYTEDISIAPVSDDAGRTVNYTAVAKDVTDHLRLETELHQSQKMESVGRLAGGVAHDFNNMLGAILGNAELALESLEPDSPVRTDIDEIVQAAKRSAEITQQLLAFARKQVVTPRVLDLNAAIGEMIKMLRRLVGENIALEFNPGASAVTVEIDPSQLHQILANLCVNARDAISDVGAVTISTGVERKGTEAGSASQGRQGAAYAVLTVRDTGCGMDNETLDHLFEPFYTTKAVGKGTGLGLAT